MSVSEVTSAATVVCAVCGPGEGDPPGVVHEGRTTEDAVGCITAFTGRRRVRPAAVAVRAAALVPLTLATAFFALATALSVADMGDAPDRTVAVLGTALLGVITALPAAGAVRLVVGIVRIPAERLTLHPDGVLEWSGLRRHRRVDLRALPPYGVLLAVKSRVEHVLRRALRDELVAEVRLVDAHGSMLRLRPWQWWCRNALMHALEHAVDVQDAAEDAA